MSELSFTQWAERLENIGVSAPYLRPIRKMVIEVETTRASIEQIKEDNQATSERISKAKKILQEIIDSADHSVSGMEFAIAVRERIDTFIYPESKEIL
jgi:high-affinity Fe2+/Pb2+ permease